jgi:hypothetical protein
VYTSALSLQLVVTYLVPYVGVSTSAEYPYIYMVLSLLFISF